MSAQPLIRAMLNVQQRHRQRYCAWGDTGEASVQCGHIPNKQETHQAQVHWRVANEVGVSFIHCAPSAVADGTEGTIGADFGQRLKKLESEVRALRRMVAELRSEQRERERQPI